MSSDYIRKVFVKVNWKESREEKEMNEWGTVVWQNVSHLVDMEIWLSWIVMEIYWKISEIAGYLYACAYVW